MKSLICAIICIIAILPVSGCSSQTGKEKAQTEQQQIKNANIKAPEKEVKETEQQTAASFGENDFLGILNASLSKVAEEVKPSVVNISTTKSISVKEHPFGEYLDDPFFRKFFGDKFHPYSGKKEV